MPCGHFGGGGGHVPLLPPPLGSGTASTFNILGLMETVSSHNLSSAAFICLDSSSVRLLVHQTSYYFDF